MSISQSWAEKLGLECKFPWKQDPMKMNTLWFFPIVSLVTTVAKNGALTLKGAGGGHIVPYGYEIACHFTKEPSRNLKTLDFS